MTTSGAAARRPDAWADPFSAALDDHIGAGEVAGAVALVWRPGEEPQVVTRGRRDLVADLPATRDTLYRIASMSKPVTTVAALSLLDEGRFTLDDAISRRVPELARPRVLVHREGPLDQTRPAHRDLTFRDLLTHRAGLSYAELESGPIATAYGASLGPEIDNERDPDTWLARLGELPLTAQPGAGFDYGVATDVLGIAIARMEQASLEEVLQARVLGPLDMTDTGFVVPPSKRHRAAALMGFDAEGHLATLEASPGGHALAHRPASMSFESGGQGLWSTVDDYLRFARLLVGAGATDGVRILQPATCALMTTNQLSAAERLDARLLGRPVFATGHGYGMGVAVVMEPERADPLVCGGGLGSVGWPGAFGGWWQADPTDGSVRILLSHTMADPAQLAEGIGLGGWSLIAAFSAATRAQPPA